jgi:hypothetical protein
LQENALRRKSWFHLAQPHLPKPLAISPRKPKISRLPTAALPPNTAAGYADEVADPKAIVNKTYYDLLMTLRL